MVIDRLFTLRDQAERLRVELSKLIEDEHPHHRVKLREEIELIKDSLEKSTVPECFRIAIVGTFKTGKSSFVNKLAEERLAGVETNPETAAITVFRYAEKPKAEVTLITQSEWQKMEDLYEESPKHPEAYRVAGLRDFNENMAKRKEKSEKPLNFDRIDPVALVNKWLKPEGNKHVIDAEKWETKEGKQTFRKNIRQFTSGSNPLHYFVKELAVYAPVPLLRDHVELIDTPGLNDTQLYRGQLTEDLLSGVDAILFLTRSGASFSQYDKEFIVRQLRKKRLRHLRLVVTKVDETFESAVRDAKEEDETPPSFGQVREKEEARLRLEISRTLDELLEDSELKDEDGLYYMEQLDALKIHFTSAVWFDDGRIDDSGIPEVKAALVEVLSENYHLQQMVEHLERTIDSIRSRLRGFFNERLSVLEAEFDPKKVETSMAQIEEKLIECLDDFESEIKQLAAVHENEQIGLQELMDANIAKMQFMARIVLSDFEKTDLALHWKSRRHGNWGYIKYVLGEKVADKVFPVLESSLNRKIKPFKDFIDLASCSLDGLESEIVKLESESAIEGLPKIEFSEAKERFMNSFIQEVKECVENEKDVVVEVLEQFANGELSEKLESAKIGVSDQWGSGTTKRQNVEVIGFYDDITNSLSQALSTYLKLRMNGFGNFLSKNADSLYPKLRISVQSMLDTRKQLIHENLADQTDAARNRLEQYLEHGIAILDGKLITTPTFEPIQKEVPQELEVDISEEATGFSYETIFGSYISNASCIYIKEPYLRFKYQLDNFKNFCGLAARSGNVKKIELITGGLEEEEKYYSDSYLEDICRRLSEDHSIEFNWQRDINLHAREIRTNDGWVILSDRGLDIYKKPESRNEFGHFDLALRKCKQTKVHIRREL